jgi:hypothetical protein
MYTVAICNTICLRFLVADQEQQHEHDQQPSYRFAQQQQSQFSDPAIMSASLGVPLLSPQEAFANAQQTFGLPPGLAFPPGLQNAVVNDGEHSSLLLLRGRQPAWGGLSDVPFTGAILPTKLGA